MGRGCVTVLTVFWFFAGFQLSTVVEAAALGGVGGASPPAQKGQGRKTGLVVLKL